MSEHEFFKKKSLSMSEKHVDFSRNRKISSRQSLKAKFDRESSSKENAVNSTQMSRTGGSWCDALTTSMSNVNAKQAWKNGTEKLTQTFNTVKTTFETFSQKIKKSTRRRQPLVNVDSPKTPATPYTRSKALLGRTPTKLYSPFSIDTPLGKENYLNRSIPSKPSSSGGTKSKKKVSKIKKRESQISSNYTFSSPERKLSNDLLQTQIGIYEFQSVANRIVQNGFEN